MTITKQQIREALVAGIIVADGHGLYDPEFYSPHFDVEQMNLVHTHRSAGGFKSTIFVDGKPVDELKAVYNLSFLEQLIRSAGLPPSTAIGRGFAAQQCVDALKKWVAE